MKKLIKLSIHPNLIPSLDKKTGAKLTKGWIPKEVEWKKDKLKELVLATGYSPAFYYQGERLESKVQEIHHVILDFDKNIPTLEQFVEMAKRFQFSWFLHTTTSHQKMPRGPDPDSPVLKTRAPEAQTDPTHPDYKYWDPTSPDCPENPINHIDLGSPMDKFRVIIPLARPISRLTLGHLAPFFLERFQYADPTSFEAARHYHPPTLDTDFRCEFFDPGGIPTFLNIEDLNKTFHKKLDISDQSTIAYIRGITEDYDVSATEGLNRKKKFAKSQIEYKQGKITNTQIRDAFDYDIPVRFKDTFITMELSEYLKDNEIIHGNTVPIFCPWCKHDYHNRGNPNKDNAFITRNAHGQLFIACTSERTTYWGPLEVTHDKNYSESLFFNTLVGQPTVCEEISEVRKLEEEALKRDIAISTGQLIDTAPSVIRELHHAMINQKDWESICDRLEVSVDIAKKLPRVDPVFIPHYKYGVTVDPTLRQKPKSEGIYNTFLPSKYYEKYLDGFYPQNNNLTLDKIPSELQAKTPLIYHILGNLFADDETLARFINWIAGILRSPDRHVDSAWMIGTETQGVGKDFMFHHILTPLFGKRQTQLVDGKNIDNHFNSSDATTWLRGYNEFFIKGDRKANNSRREQLKSRITSRNLIIDEKYVKEYESKSYLHFILFGNDPVPMYLEPGDRRFNISWTTKDQSCKLMELDYYKNNFKNRHELEVAAASEITAFAEIVFTMKYDLELADVGIINDAKRELISLSLSTLDMIVLAIQGDTDQINFREAFIEDLKLQNPSIKPGTEVFEAELAARLQVAEHYAKHYNFISSTDWSILEKYYKLLRTGDAGNLTKALKKRQIYYQRYRVTNPISNKTKHVHGYKYNTKRAKREEQTN